LLGQKKVGKEKVFFVRRFGLRPALLFFASPKKSKQKKGEPKAVALRAALHYSWRAGAQAPAGACAWERRAAAISGPSSKPPPIDYNRIASQSRPTNPPRNLPHQHPYPEQKHKIGCSSSPSPPEGVKGRGEAGVKKSRGQASGDRPIHYPHE
jgi:hypothetical protein